MYLLLKEVGCEGKLQYMWSRGRILLWWWLLGWCVLWTRLKGNYKQEGGD
jgi:hypothetical protein